MTKMIWCKNCNKKMATGEDDRCDDCREEMNTNFWNCLGCSVIGFLFLLGIIFFILKVTENL